MQQRARPASGALSAALTSLPEFLLAAALLVVRGVWLQWFPPFGWKGTEYAVLPALALGNPAGGLMGLLLSDAVRAGFAEKWVATWRMAGAGPLRLTVAVLRRALPAVLPQIGLVLIGLTGGAVAVEKVYAIPGLGRTLLGAASAQDIPALQAGMLALMGLALLVGTLTTAARHLLIGPAVRFGSLPLAEPPRSGRGRQLTVPAVAGAVAGARHLGRAAARPVCLCPCQAGGAHMVASLRCRRHRSRSPCPGGARRSGNTRDRAGSGAGVPGRGNRRRALPAGRHRPT
ncbi:ABC transporter permease subunit [Pseudarthrobacter sp. NamB4]|uniref:ABC transporter permease subunit n=1 Tax=Pseudarthrobacter sp. NamB4 TaxID=2576837 RepID=UPI001F0FF198|nr:ABC transporter permease subunit [Pseudarthrobacter sp. NamB4]